MECLAGRLGGSTACSAGRLCQSVSDCRLGFELECPVVSCGLVTWHGRAWRGTSRAGFECPMGCRQACASSHPRSAQVWEEGKGWQGCAAPGRHQHSRPVRGPTGVRVLELQRVWLREHACKPASWRCCTTPHVADIVLCSQLYCHALCEPVQKPGWYSYIWFCYLRSGRVPCERISACTC